VLKDVEQIAALDPVVGNDVAGIQRTVGNSGNTEPIPRTVHLLRSLKHPAEVEALRRVYGPGSGLIAW
jgi:hypothetical protein